MIETAKDKFADTIGCVEVGKMLRKKYLDPESVFYAPDYFKGSAAPEHTEAEAYELMLLGVNQAICEGKRMVLIDGQPRTLGQLSLIKKDFERTSVVICHIFATTKVRRARAILRDINRDERLLTDARMQGDLPAIYEVLTMSGFAGMTISDMLNHAPTKEDFRDSCVTFLQDSLDSLQK